MKAGRGSFRRTWRGWASGTRLLRTNPRRSFPKDFRLSLTELSLTRHAPARGCSARRSRRFPCGARTTCVPVPKGSRKFSGTRRLCSGTAERSSIRPVRLRLSKMKYRQLCSLRSIRNSGSSIFRAGLERRWQNGACPREIRTGVILVLHRRPFRRSGIHEAKSAKPSVSGRSAFVEKGIFSL